MTLHRHHKIPRHAGGTDDPENIELLTIEEHAEAHRVLYEKHGRWQDKFAWKMLGALDERAWLEAMHAAKLEMMNDPAKVEQARVRRSAGVRRAYQEGLVVWNKGGTDPRCRKISQNTKLQSARGPAHFHCIGDFQRGKAFSEEHRSKLKERARSRRKHVCQCGAVVSPAMFARWHGEKCKRRP